jgi:hypothetical protein
MPSDGGASPFGGLGNVDDNQAGRVTCDDLCAVADHPIRGGKEIEGAPLSLLLVLECVRAGVGQSVAD